MNNFDRIQKELADESIQRAGDVGLPADVFLAIALEVVDLEDQHRMVKMNINQEVATLVTNGANAREDG